MFSSKTIDKFQEFINNSDFSEEQKASLIHHRYNILKQAIFNIGAGRKLIINDEDRAALVDELNRIVYFAGGAIPLFSDPHYVTPPPDASDNERLKIEISNLLKFLLIGTPFNFSVLYQKATYDSLFKKRDPEFMAAMRKGFQDVFNGIDLELLNKLDDRGERRFAIQLTNMLAMYTLCDPFKDAELTLPQKVAGRWQRISFIIAPLELAPDKEKYPKLYSLYADEQGRVRSLEQRVFAYVLAAKDLSLDISPYLLFSGTPPETGQGHLFAALTDFYPGHSVGETMYRSSREMLHAFLGTFGKKFRITGQSLGGILPLYLAGDAPQFIDSIDVFNPPAPYEKTLKGDLFMAWSKTDENNKPPVVVHLQQHDPVKFVGKWHDDWTIVLMFPKKHETLLSSYWAHIKSFANEPGSISLYVNNERENNRFRRWLATGIKTSIGDSIIHRMLTSKTKSHNESVKAEKASQDSPNNSSNSANKK